jgi:PadR family transcriptional regulator, regulatory protein PadR
MNVLRLAGREFTILGLLIQRGEAFGLELVTRAPDQLPRGTIYVTLQRMEKKGYVTSRLVSDAAGGAARRMYRATGRGYRMYHAIHREMSNVS